MDDERWYLNSGELVDAGRRRGHVGCRVHAPGEVGGDDVAVVLLIELEAAPGHGATEVDLQLGDVLIGLDRAVKTSEHRVVTRREAGVRPWGGADERQGAHAIGVPQGSG